ncbi:hypothetical protein GF415_04000 [Candidatus Micrarchaeota archaeon]|nr:hypothetical protein [Candidatus Micrarchaeota archaeon]
MGSHNQIMVLGVIAILAALLIVGCMQEEQEEDARGEPPYQYNQLSYIYEELVQEPEDYEEIYQCIPPEMENHCDGETRYFNFVCVDGEWEYDTEECAYECNDGVCINTGCPPCDDGDPCTTDLCSGAPDYECLNIPIAGCGETQGPAGTKACVPTAEPGSEVRIDVYPAGTPISYQGEPYMSQLLTPGEKMQVDEDDSITLSGFWLEGSCPACFEEPIIKFPPEAKITITKDLSGIMATSYKGEGELGYMCIEGTCRERNTAGCIDYVCNHSMRFVISEINADFTCS